LNLFFPTHFELFPSAHFHVSWLSVFIFYPKPLYKSLHQSFFYSFITILPSESGVTLDYCMIFPYTRNLSFCHFTFRLPTAPASRTKSRLTEEESRTKDIDEKCSNFKINYCLNNAVILECALAHGWLVIRLSAIFFYILKGSRVGGCVMVLNATFNNISVISSRILHNIILQCKAFNIFQVYKYFLQAVVYFKIWTFFINIFSHFLRVRWLWMNRKMIGEAIYIRVSERK
jgi:hypothetical protein